MNDEEITSRLIFNNASSIMVGLDPEKIKNVLTITIKRFQEAVQDIDTFIEKENKP